MIHGADDRTCSVQKEVNQQVQRLLPASVRGISSAVPIATLGEGIGWRTVREEINSPLSGYGRSLSDWIVYEGVSHVDSTGHLPWSG